MNKFDPFNVLSRIFDDEKTSEIREVKNSETNIVKNAKEEIVKEKNINEEIIKEESSNTNTYKLEDYNNLRIFLSHIVSEKEGNDIANLLMNEYGGFANIVEANSEDIVEKTGIEKKIANLITSIPEISGYYRKSKWEHENLDLSDSKVVGEYAVDLLFGKTEEYLYIICLDSAQRLKKAEIVSQGVVNEINIQPRKLIEICVNNKAVNVVLTHNHPSGILMPSEADILATRYIQNILLTVDIVITDHFIVAGNQYFSMAENGFM